MRKHWMSIFILASVTSATLTFQNCGRSDLQFEDLESIELASFFSYPYSSAPQFYTDVFLFRPQSSNSLNQFKFLGVVTYPAQNTTDVQYEVKVQDSSNQTLCPTQTGTLKNGISSIEFDCITSRPATEVNIHMTVSALGFQQVVDKKYR